MRPNAPHDPAVKLVEKLADMGLAIVITPSADDRVDLGDQLSSAHRSLSLCTLSDLILEMSDGFLPWERIEASRSDTTADLVGSKL